MKKKIYIAGCGGMLGEAFYTQFKDDYEIKCTDKDVNADWLSFLDFRDFEAYKKDVFDFKPDYLFHLGAYTDLEWCEMNADELWDTTMNPENRRMIQVKLDSIEDIESFMNAVFSEDKEYRNQIIDEFIEIRKSKTKDNKEYK